MCRGWLAGYSGSTVIQSYHSSQLSTVEFMHGASPATKVLDFADLPCPPSDAAQEFDSGAPYYPVLAPLSIDRGGLYSGCEIAAIRDPPVHAVRVSQISGPKDDDDGIAR